MRKIFATIYLILCFSLNASAQFTDYFNIDPNSEAAVCIRQTTDSSYILAIGGGGSGNDEGVIVRLNPAGSSLWSHADYTPSLGSADYVLENKNSDYTFLEELSIVESPNLVLKRFSKTGTLIWAKDTLVPWESSGGSIIEDADSNLIITATFNFTEVLLIKCNKYGDTILTKKYIGNHSIGGVSIIEGIDNGYIMVCGQTSGYSYTQPSTVVIKTDTLGNELWRKTFAQTIYSGKDGILKNFAASEYVLCLNEYDSINNKNTPALYMLNISGDTISTHSFPSSDTITAAAVQFGSSNGYIITTNLNRGIRFLFTNSNATLIGTQFFNGVTYDLQAYSMIKNNEGKLAICGGVLDSAGSYPFNSFAAVINVAYDTVHTNVNKYSESNSITLYPNPTTTSFTITTTGSKIKEVKVFDVVGSLVISHLSLGNTNETIDMSGVSKGIYFVQILDEKMNVVNRKVIIQ